MTSTCFTHPLTDSSRVYTKAAFYSIVVSTTSISIQWSKLVQIMAISHMYYYLLAISYKNLAISFQKWSDGNNNRHKLILYVEISSLWPYSSKKLNWITRTSCSFWIVFCLLFRLCSIKTSWNSLFIQVKQLGGPFTFWWTGTFKSRGGCAAAVTSMALSSESTKHKRKIYSENSLKSNIICQQNQIRYYTKTRV